MLRYRDRATPSLNNDGMIKLGDDVEYQTEPNSPNLSFFSETHLINEDSGFCTQILLTDLQCHVFLLTSSPRNDVAVLD